MNRDETSEPKQLPEIERIPEVPGWESEALREFFRKCEGQGSNGSPSVEDHPLDDGGMVRRFSSIQEAMRYARKIAPGTVVGPVWRDDE